MIFSYNFTCSQPGLLLFQVNDGHVRCIFCRAHVQVCEWDLHLCKGIELYADSTREPSPTPSEVLAMDLPIDIAALISSGEDSGGEGSSSGHQGSARQTEQMEATRGQQGQHMSATRQVARHQRQQVPTIRHERQVLATSHQRQQAPTIRHERQILATIHQQQQVPMIRHEQQVLATSHQMSQLGAPVSTTRQEEVSVARQQMRQKQQEQQQVPAASQQSEPHTDVESLANETIPSSSEGNQWAESGVARDKTLEEVLQVGGRSGVEEKGVPASGEDNVVDLTTSIVEPQSTLSPWELSEVK